MSYKARRAVYAVYIHGAVHHMSYIIFVVQLICHTAYSSCILSVVQSMSCSVRGIHKVSQMTFLFIVCVVQHICRTAYLSYSLFVIHDICRTAYLMYIIFVVQSSIRGICLGVVHDISRTTYVLYSLFVVQLICRTKHIVHYTRYISNGCYNVNSFNYLNLDYTYIVC